MQAQTPEVSGEKAITSPIKRYIVSEQFGDDEVTLEVNHEVLTPDVAALINDFWSAGAQRLAEENGDVVRSVIRLFGERMIVTMLGQGGASFTVGYRSPMDGTHPGKYWTAEIHNEEGWGGSIDGSPYGFCGIQCIAAEVNPPDFDGLQVEEVFPKQRTPGEGGVR